MQKPQCTQDRRISFDRAIAGVGKLLGGEVGLHPPSHQPIRPGLRMPRGSNRARRPAVSAASGPGFGRKGRHAGSVAGRTHQRGMARHGPPAARAGRSPAAHAAARSARRPSQQHRLAPRLRATIPGAAGGRHRQPPDIARPARETRSHRASRPSAPSLSSGPSTSPPPSSRCNCPAR